MKKLRIRTHLRVALAALLLQAAATVALAVPYATALKYENGTVSFVLNEPADNVKITWNNGASSRDLGAQPKGTVTASITLAGAFKVIVSRTAPGGWTQTSDDANPLMRFNSPRGIAVNQNPQSPYFGRVYVANSAAGTAGGRSVGDGIYMLNADQTDAVGQGNTARTADLSFASGSSSPYRLTVGEDNQLYICDWSDATGNLHVTDPNVGDGSGQPVFPALVEGPSATMGAIPLGPDNNHGSVCAVVVLGTLAQGNLTVYTIDEDLQTDPYEAASVEMNSLWRYDVGAGPLPWASLPSVPKLYTADINYASQTMDLDRGPDGKLYASDRRSTGGQNGVHVIDEFGTVLWASRQASLDLGETADMLAETGAIAVSPDGKYLAAYAYGTNAFSQNSIVVSVLPMVDGIPDMARRKAFATGTVAAGRDIDFDAAGNVHIVSSGHTVYRVYSPGGASEATTGSDGTFVVNRPETIIDVTATVDSTTEGSGAPASFTFTRTGDTSGALTVSYTVAGSATAGSDYTSLPGTVPFADGETTASVSISSLEDATAEPVETVVLTLSSGSDYSAGAAGSATVTIQDNEPPAIFISPIYDSAYERTAGDYLSYRLTRWGDTNAEVSVNLTYAGTAAPADFNGPATVYLLSGALAESFTVTTVDNAALDGDRTVIATVAAGTGYTVGSPAAASGTILDDELESEAGQILFADTFDTDTSANWTVLFGANNNIEYQDKTAAFGYDFVNTDWLPAAPGGSTTGLKLTVNKDDPTDYGAAGVNVYPKGQTFTGDYAVRFHMYLNVNASAGTTEHVLMGINHTGTRTNWVRQSTGNVVNEPKNLDGLWFGIVADGYLGHVLYTGTNADSGATVLANIDAVDFANVFKSPPFNPGDTGIGGAPANAAATQDKNWVDVEIKTVSDRITLSINRIVLFDLPNPTSSKTGTMMLGYNDQFDSIGTDGAVYFDNLRVVRLKTEPVPTPTITGIKAVGAGLQITFTSTSGEAAQFQVVGAATVTDNFAVVTDATIQKTGDGQFLATVPQIRASQQFYRIKR